MKKRSKIWKEFCQVISIVDIGINKQQRKLIKLNKSKVLLVENLDEIFIKIDYEKSRLDNLTIEKEPEALKMFFRRRDGLKSIVESLFFDASLLQREIENLDEEIKKVEIEKLRLEKRKDILEELKKQIS